MNSNDHPPRDSSPTAIATEPPSIRVEVGNVLGAEAVFEMNGQLSAFRVSAKNIHEACRRLWANGFDYLVFVTAVDYPAENRIEIVYVISSYSDEREFCLVADVGRGDPRIETVSDVWETADWHEREVFDLFGVRFENHPDLRRILLDDTWEGHPLRKDYEDKVHGVVKRPADERGA